MVARIKRDTPIKDRLRICSKTARNGCLEWTGAINHHGYGVLTARRIYQHTQTAHVAAWVEYKGAIPDGLYVCHSCDNKRCINVAHLFLGTPQDNVADREAKGRGAKGERHWHAKMTEKDVLKIRQLHETGTSPKELRAQYGINRSTLDSIIYGRSWRYLLRR